VNSPAPAVSPDGWEWLERGIVSGDLLVPGNHARSWIFNTVRADRDGPLTYRLLTLTTDGRASVRRTVFELLVQLCFQRSDWPLVADAAEAALDDVDPPVRCTAAVVLVHLVEPGRAVAVLNASTDPVARIALMHAMLRRKVPEYQTVAGYQATLSRLRRDPVAAVRLLAGVAVFSVDDPAAWRALDTAIRADLEASIGVLNTLGPHFAETAGALWARALAGVDRLHDCCAWAERLADPTESPRVRLEGIRMAVVAMHTWRAAPGRVTPMLTGLIEEHPSEVRSAALRALASSLTASRLAADDLAAMMDDPELGAVAATALGCVGDHRAVPHLARLLLSDSTEPRLAAAFRAVARAGADPEAPVAAARQILAAVPDSCAPELPMQVLAAFGPAAAAAMPELIAKLEGAENDTPDWAFYVLGEIGPAAAAAVPTLRYHPTAGAKSALLKITSDRAVAERHLAGCRDEPRRGRFTSQVLMWLAEHGGLTTRQHKQLRSLFRHPGFEQVESAGALWLHEGPAVADELLAVLSTYLSDDLRGPGALRVITAMGSHARPILDRLDQLIASRRRMGFDLGDDDAEMRADEMLLAAMIAAREQVARV
jgi:hypothetical protein